MKTSKDLTRAELEAIVDTIRQSLYLSFNARTGVMEWDPSKEADDCEVRDVAERSLAHFGLTPDRSEPFHAN